MSNLYQWTDNKWLLDPRTLAKASILLLVFFQWHGKIRFFSLTIFNNGGIWDIMSNHLVLLVLSYSLETFQRRDQITNKLQNIKTTNIFVLKTCSIHLNVLVWLYNNWIRRLLYFCSPFKPYRYPLCLSLNMSLIPNILGSLLI